MFEVKSCRKCAKDSPRHLFIFGKVNQSNHYMEEIISKIRYFERGLPNPLKKLTLLFSLKPASFYYTILSKTKEAWN